MGGQNKGIARSSSQVGVRMMAAVQEMAQYKVDLSKATEACERLNNQLTSAEKERTDISNQLSENEKELKVARAAKDEAVRVKLEIEQKHQVLTEYYNQREAELQKHLGLLSAKLGDAEEGSESSAKKLSHLFEELESYKAQCKSYKAEMEEQERSLKSQNAALEKRHHESWVTVRQESRKMADAQNEMQTLRNRLTIAETKLLEREVEIKNFQDETKTLKEAMENLVEKSSVSSQKSTNQPLVSNGSINYPTSVDNISYATIVPENDETSLCISRSIEESVLHYDDEPPPDLPPLTLPSIPYGGFSNYSTMHTAETDIQTEQPQFYQESAQHFGTGLARNFSYARRRPDDDRCFDIYGSRSPSPPPDDERYPPKADRRHNMSSARSDISNRERRRGDKGSGYDSYCTSGYEYSPPPSPRYNHGGRRSSRHSPDRAYMENGETTEDDRHGYTSGSNNFRDRPNHHSRRRENALGDDSAHGGAQQGKHGPKTSSPMV